MELLKQLKQNLYGGMMSRGKEKHGISMALRILFTMLIIGYVGCSSNGNVKGNSDFPKAPSATFVDIEGNTTEMSSYAGKSVVLVNFWGIRCQNCIEEIPFLERLQSKYGSKGLVVLGVNTDGIDSATLKKFLPRLPVNFNYPVIIDPDFTLVDTFKMMAAPLTVVIAKDSTVRYRHEGYEPEIESTYVDLIEQLLTE